MRIDQDVVVVEETILATLTASSHCQLEEVERVVIEVLEVEVGGKVVRLRDTSRRMVA